ncbi:hypothetical protein PG988_012098 [Apiospora saccharicola]
MRPQLLLLLALSRLTNAGRFAVDASCQGVRLAENALDVMTNHPGDQWVQKMAKYVLGTENYEAKFNAMKDTFRRVAAYEKEPYPHLPTEEKLDVEEGQIVSTPTDDWLKERTNMDVELYCGDGRFLKRNPDDIDEYWRDKSTAKLFGGKAFPPLKRCYTPGLVLGSGQEVAKASTMRSSVLNKSGYLEAQKTNPDVSENDFLKHKPHTANTMDICPWFWKRAVDQGWPKVDAEMVEASKKDKFRDDLSHGQTPIDGLKTFGVTMLHEIPPGVTSCNNWLCVGALKTEKNADSAAMLGLAMKLWSLKHYTEDDGTVHSYQ